MSISTIRGRINKQVTIDIFAFFFFFLSLSHVDNDENFDIDRTISCLIL